jgi:hypothetical protein
MFTDDVAETKVRLPICVEHADIDFALFCITGSTETVYIKSGAAPIELTGARPIEDFDVSPGDFWIYLINLLASVFGRSFEWTMSLPFANNENTIQLVLVWRGFATRRQRTRIKKIFDQHAFDIYSGIARGDEITSVLSLAPIITLCWSNDRKGRILRAALLSSGMIVLLILLRWLFLC